MDFGDEAVSPSSRPPGANTSSARTTAPAATSGGQGQGQGQGGGGKSLAGTTDGTLVRDDGSSDWKCSCGFKFNAAGTLACAACDRQRPTAATAAVKSTTQAALTPPAAVATATEKKRIPSHYESEDEEDAGGWTTPALTTPASVRRNAQGAQAQAQAPQPRAASVSAAPPASPPAAASTGGPKVAVTAIAPADGTGTTGATGVLGYISLPAAAHEVKFSTVRKMIEAGAGGALQGKPPQDFVFVRAGAPVGRKQEAKFTVLAKLGEPALIVIREKLRATES